MAKTLGKIKPVEVLFDNSVGYDEDAGIVLAQDLSPEERRQAAMLYRVFTPPNEVVGLWGLCLVVGDPGNGKDTFGNILSWKIKRFFPQKRVLRDEPPRLLYGNYAGLFNESVIQGDLAKMREIAKGASAVTSNYNDALANAADQWVTSEGHVLLKDSVLYLTEFWRYCYKREPHNPMNKTMGGIHKEKRHLDTLIIGTTQQVDDLDRFTCLPWVDWRVTCVRSVANSTGFVYYVEKVKYDRRLNTLLPIGRPFPIAWDAGRPRSELGNGEIVLRSLDYVPVTEDERVVIDLLRAGMNNYEDIVAFVEQHGDMDEREVLAALKALRFGKTSKGQFKRVIDYPCFFDLFNSKSAPQMRSSLRIED